MASLISTSVLSVPEVAAVKLSGNFRPWALRLFTHPSLVKHVDLRDFRVGDEDDAGGEASACVGDPSAAAVCWALGCLHLLQYNFMLLWCSAPQLLQHQATGGLS